MWELIGLYFLTFIQEDTATISGGLLGLHGTFPYWQPLLALLLGMWTSDFIVHCLGRVGGLALFRFRWMRWIVSEQKIGAATEWFERFGWATLVFSRLVPGSRTALLFASGLLRYSRRKFLLVSFFGNLAWLVLVFSLFARFGLGALGFLGSRWILSLVLLVSGGGAAGYFAARKLFRRRIIVDKVDTVDSLD
jgi:membrane protein DedA with SNARE-associated domain